MVTGIEIFRQYFQEHPDNYILIGGVACDLVLNSMRLQFRLTDDFDIVIVSENLQGAFGNKLKEFIRDGRYKVQHRKSNDRPTFFRFADPEKENFPAQLELASNKPAEDWVYDFAPLDIGDEKSSLSAILFEPEYYNFIRSNSFVLEGISTIRLEGLIPLKALAYQELSQIKSPTQKTLLDIEKHSNDIFLLARALSSEEFKLPQLILSNLKNSLNRIVKNELSDEQIELVEHIRQVYLLP